MIGAECRRFGNLTITNQLWTRCGSYVPWMTEGEARVMAGNGFDPVTRLGNPFHGPAAYAVVAEPTDSLRVSRRELLSDAQKPSKWRVKRWLPTHR